jgi:hypothetical protein
MDCAIPSNRSAIGSKYCYNTERCVQGDFMPSVTEKDVLASLSRLRGASVSEVAADLGVPQADLVPIVAELAERGYIRAIGDRVAAAAGGRERFLPDELAHAVLSVTNRGSVELR